MNEATKKYRYKASYGDLTAHPEGITAAELSEKNLCGTDALLVASVLYPPDGSLSVLFLSLDGRTGKDLSDHEWFKVWTLLSKRLSESETLDGGRKEFAKITWDALRDALLSQKQHEPHVHSDKCIACNPSPKPKSQ